jgi:hypothetical protein
MILNCSVSVNLLTNLTLVLSGDIRVKSSVFSFISCLQEKRRRRRDRTNANLFIPDSGYLQHPPKPLAGFR